MSDTAARPPTKKALRQRCQEILAAHQPGQRIPVDSPDGQFLLGIVQMHPHAHYKIGSGVACFEVRMNVAFRGIARGFWLRRTDGTETEWSFNRCLRPQSTEQRIKTLLRRAIEQDILEFKAERDGSPDDDVHHDPPSFNEICNAWASTQGGYPAIELASARDGQFGRKFADPATESDFRVFHALVANLRVVRRKDHWYL